jgi:hypothetical protein
MRLRLNSFVSRRRLVGIGAVLGVFAFSACVSNPGEFTIGGQPGSTLTLTGDGITSSFPLGTPACADGRDDDVDGLTDFGSDPQCDSAQDANERIDGVQAFVQGSWPVDIDANGVITADPADFSYQQRESCVAVGSEVWCLGVTFRGTGAVQTGSITTTSVTIPASTVVELDAIVGFPGLPANCQIGPTSGTLSASSYNATTGETTLVMNDVSVAAVTTCGDYNAPINANLGLPGESDSTLVAKILNDEGEPVQTT